MTEAAFRGETLSDDAASVRTSLEADPQQGSLKLIDFAAAYARNRALHHHALVLRQSYLKADGPDREARVRGEMMELVDHIVEDREAGSSDTAERTRTARRRVQEHFRALSPPREVVFASHLLTKTYRKSGFSLRDVSLTMRQGTITGVVGQNAHGKTTLFRMVAGEIRPDAGTLTFPTLRDSERGPDWARVREIMAYVPQELPRWHGSLLPTLQYEAALHGIRGDANREEVDFIVERLGLGDHLDKRWNQLSGGFKLRFSLARALVWRPQLLLLDEPLANLDFQAQLVVLRDLRDLASSLRYPMAVLISSQHLHEIEAVADEILFLREGEVVYNGPVGELGAARRHNTFELGSALPQKELSARLGDFPVQDLSHSGLSYVLTTPLEVDGNQLLRRLVEGGVEVEYFRDISGSIKQLFE